MARGFADHLAFAAILTLRNVAKEIKKEEKLFKTQQYYQEIYEEIADESKKLCDRIVTIAEKAMTVYYVPSIPDGIRQLPLFCFGKIIHKQRCVTSEQNRVLKLFFNNLNLAYSQPRYIDAMISGRNIGNFNELMELTEHNIGSFWLDLFRSIHKVRSPQEYQSIIDSVTYIIMRFAILGNSNIAAAKDICNELIDNANHHINRCLDARFSDIDWLGIVPVLERKNAMLESYNSFIDNSGITSDIDGNELRELFDVMFLNSICDMVMMTAKDNSTKLEMIRCAVRFVDIECVIAPEQYVKDIANNSGAGLVYHNMFMCTPTCGQFWMLLLTMAAKANQRDECMQFLNDFISILIQVEEHLDDLYSPLGAKQLAQRYTSHIVSSIKKEITDGGGSLYG